MSQESKTKFLKLNFPISLLVGGLGHKKYLLVFKTNKQTNTPSRDRIKWEIDTSVKLPLNNDDYNFLLWYRRRFVVLENDAEIFTNKTAQSTKQYYWV